MNPSHSLLIRNAHVLCLDDAGREWPRADIVVEDGRIAAIGPDAGRDWPRPFDRVIEAEGLLAMPGLINAHFHSPGNLMKGMLPGYPLEIFMLHECPPLAPSGDGGAAGLCAHHAGRARDAAPRHHRRARRRLPRARRDHANRSTRSCRPTRTRASAPRWRSTSPNVVEYDKYPYLAELLPEAEKRAMDAGAAPERRRADRHCTDT